MRENQLTIPVTSALSYLVAFIAGAALVLLTVITMSFVNKTNTNQLAKQLSQYLPASNTVTSSTNPNVCTGQTTQTNSIGSNNSMSGTSTYNNGESTSDVLSILRPAGVNNSYDNETSTSTTYNTTTNNTTNTTDSYNQKNSNNKAIKSFNGNHSHNGNGNTIASDNNYKSNNGNTIASGNTTNSNVNSGNLDGNTTSSNNGNTTDSNVNSGNEKGNTTNSNVNSGNLDGNTTKVGLSH